MKLLLDQGLPRSAAALLREAGHDAAHTGECDLAGAADSAILDFARARGQVVVTLDADFHALMALTEATAPSVIRLRIEGLRAEPAAELIQRVLDRCEEDLAGGALVSVTGEHIRVRSLPIGSSARSE